MRNANPRVQAEVRTEAIEWLITFSEEGVDAQVRRRFDEWLRSSPEHVAMYLRIAALWQDADRIEPKSRRDIARLVQEANTECNVYPLGANVPRTSRKTPPRYLSRRALAGTALLLTLASVGTVWHILYRGPTYTTTVGELRTITLEDGSVVTLDADSRLRVSFTRKQRLIELVDGQALFRVAKDAARPFVVHSNNTDVTAVGTQFDVNRDVSGTVVTVLEGRVSVRDSSAQSLPNGRVAGPLLVSAGEQAIVTPEQTSKHPEPHSASVAAWTNGLLVFDSQPLRQVVRAFNRQSAKQLIIADSELEDLRVSGVFPATGAGSLAEFLHERFGVRIVETDTAIRIERPQG